MVSSGIKAISVDFSAHGVVKDWTIANFGQKNGRSP
jgi:hypothetical protein